MNNNYYQLVLDVSGEYSYLYLLLNHQIIKTFINKNNRDLSVKLNEYINNLLVCHNISINQINNLYLVTGPGKFSGMRIGSVFVKTIKLMYPKILLWIIDKFSFLSTKKNIIILNADGNKSFVCVKNNQDEILSPQLVDNNKLDELIFPYMNEYEIIKDYAKDDNHVTTNLKYFKLVDEDFLLQYWKNNY